MCVTGKAWEHSTYIIHALYSMYVLVHTHIHSHTQTHTHADAMCFRYQFKGLISKFNCSEETAVSYVWLLNGTHLGTYSEEERNRHNISVNEEILSLRADICGM